MEANKTSPSGSANKTKSTIGKFNIQYFHEFYNEI